MGRRIRLSSQAPLALAAVVLLTTVGCGDSEQQQRKQLLQVQPRVEQQKEQVLRQRVATPDGKLQPSDEVVLGLQLPRGLKLDKKMERRWVFETASTIEQLQAYFGPRLDTGSVSPSGGAVTYRYARAPGAQGDVHFDLLIGQRAANPGMRFVDIRQYPPPPAKALTDEEVRRQLAEIARRGG